MLKSTFSKKSPTRGSYLYFCTVSTEKGSFWMQLHSSHKSSIFSRSWYTQIILKKYSNIWRLSDPCKSLQSLLDAYFKCKSVLFGATTVFQSKVAFKNKLQYLSLLSLCITHQTSSNNHQPVIMIRFVANKDLMLLNISISHFNPMLSQSLI